MKDKVFYKIAFILLLLLPMHLYAQVINGKVTDAANGSPLENVNVYLDGTYQGTTTDNQGNFTLNNTLKTSAPIIISSVGYQAQKINNYNNEVLKIALKRKVIALKEVTVQDDDEIRRAKAMRIFLKEFIGNSDCEISNRDDIYFHYNKKKDLLTADSDKPLLIHNKTLGYTITFFLNDFSHQPLQTTYKGNYFFAEDTAGLSANQIKKIMQARDEAYYGSRLHFIRALWGNALAKNNFVVYRTLTGAIDYGKKYDLPEGYLLPYERIIENTDGQKFVLLSKANLDEKKFDKDEVYITYRKGFASFMRQKSGSAGVIIDSNGYHDEGLQWKGSFGTARVGKLLPYEFQPTK